MNIPEAIAVLRSRNDRDASPAHINQAIDTILAHHHDNRWRTVGEERPKNGVWVLVQSVLRDGPFLACAKEGHYDWYWVDAVHIFPIRGGDRWKPWPGEVR